MIKIIQKKNQKLKILLIIIYHFFAQTARLFNKFIF
jgi:hypothetical protein